MDDARWMESRCKMRGRAALVASLAIPALLVSLQAAAEEPAHDPAAADVLYQAGRDLLTKGDSKGACAKFDASMALDPAATTLVQIARCHERAGRLSLAWSEFNRARGLNRETARVERRKALEVLIDEAIAALDRRLPRLRIIVQPKVDGLTLKRDGTVLPAATVGEAMPLDPGEHTIEASAPGFALQLRKVTVAEGSRSDLAITLVPGDDKPGIPVWTWIVGGAGLALVGAGVGLRVDGAAAEATLDRKCGKDRICDPASGYDPTPENERKNRDFNLFVGLTVAGGAAVGAAVIGMIVRPGSRKAGAASIRFVPTPGGAMITGVF